MIRFGGCWGVITLIACLLIGGCGGSASSSRRHSQVVTLLMAASPDSLDPALGHTGEALEADWLVYTPLLTYFHSDGTPGTQVIPGLASALPTISDGGRTYTLTLRPGLVYSDGKAVKASDFTRAVERALRLGWAGAPEFISRRIVGAAAFARGRAKTIAGITTDDAIGQITIQLTAPYGPFENVLAFPALAPVPSGTPFKDEQRDPPPGVGPYRLVGVVPGRSFSVVRNPLWRRGEIPGIPAGNADIAVRVTGNAEGDAVSVLENRADVFDWPDRIPPTVLARILRQASTRYSKQAINTTDLIFMNLARKPFSSQLARIAVQTGLDDSTLKQLGSGTLQEGCYLLPPSMFGHPHDQCPRGNIKAGGSLGAARALVARSGMANTRVTVWAQAAAPFSSWAVYYTGLLNRIGFNARLKLVHDSAYVATIGDVMQQPQTGLVDFKAAVPNPIDFYQRLTGRGILDGGGRNWAEIDDPHVNQQMRILGAVPASNLSAVVGFWHGLERYVAQKAYLAAFGYQTAPQFVSDRLLYRALVFSPVAGLDWSSFRLK